MTDSPSAFELVMSGGFRRLGALARDKRGSTATIFAFAVIPIVMLTGFGLVVVDVYQARDQLNAAADAAALSAVGRSYLGTTTAVARSGAVAVFNAQSTLNGVKLVSSDVVVTDSGLTRTAVASYSATIATPFMQLLGTPGFTISGSATSTTALPSYIDFYLLLDNTPSMGIGATQPDIDKMVANTSDKCAFACHQLDASPNDYYTKAKTLGVTKRIDVVRTATQNLMDTATATQTNTGQYRAAIYTFGPKAEARALTSIATLTSNLSSAKTAASTIDLMTVPNSTYNNDQDTDFDSIFTDVNSAIAAPGDGSSASSPQKILFFVSDGVADANYPSTCSQSTLGGGRCQEPIKVANCTKIKNRGIKIAVLYTTYYPLPTNAWYNSTVAPWASQISPNMASCASPGLFFEVSPSQGISDAMNALFLKAVQQARLSQ